MTTTTVTTDRLREAAKVLRESAKAATPGPWSAHGVMVQAPIGDVAYDMDDCDSAYIATMHPGVGLALADLLVSMAETLEMSHLRDRATWEMADLLADLILGGER